MKHKKKNKNNISATALCVKERKRISQPINYGNSGNLTQQMIIIKAEKEGSSFGLEIDEMNSCIVFGCIKFYRI